MGSAKKNRKIIHRKITPINIIEIEVDTTITVIKTNQHLSKILPLSAYAVDTDQ